MGQQARKVTLASKGLKVHKVNKAFLDQRAALVFRADISRATRTVIAL